MAVLNLGADHHEKASESQVQPAPEKCNDDGECGGSEVREASLFERVGVSTCDEEPYEGSTENDAAESPGVPAVKGVTKNRQPRRPTWVHSALFATLIAIGCIDMIFDTLF